MSALLIVGGIWLMLSMVLCLALAIAGTRSTPKNYEPNIVNPVSWVNVTSEKEKANKLPASKPLQHVQYP